MIVISKQQIRSNSLVYSKTESRKTLSVSTKVSSLACFKCDTIPTNTTSNYLFSIFISICFILNINIRIKDRHRPMGQVAREELYLILS